VSLSIDVEIAFPTHKRKFNNSRIMWMVYGLVLWFVAAQLAMADRKSSKMARMVGVHASSSSSSSRSGRTVSIGTGEYSSTNHLHCVYEVASHHPKSFNQDVEIVDNAIQDLLMNFMNDVPLAYSLVFVDCQENLALSYLLCSAYSYYFESPANLDPLGPALVDLISDLSDQYRDQYSVTWEVLPETPNVAEYMYDIVLLDYKRDDNNKTMMDAWGLVDKEISKEIHRANVKIDWNGGEGCGMGLCQTDEEAGDVAAAENDDRDFLPSSLDDVLCYNVSCLVYTVEKNMGPRVQSIVKHAVQVVDDHYDWFNVTFVPDDGPDVVYRTNAAVKAVATVGQAVREAVASG
jgi:hypothetical protein